MKLNKKNILNLLKQINIDESKTVSDSEFIRSIKIEDTCINVDILTPNPSLQFKNKIQKQVEDLILAEYPEVTINLNFSVPKEKANSPTSNIKNVIAVASGKGGVGKSTISSNLAIGLKKAGYTVGIIDADIYGPSIPLMFDSEQARPKLVDNTTKSLMDPVVSYGIKIMSIGFFTKINEAVVWRGPMATKALNQIINETNWGDLDYLLIDLPPGTSDIHLTLVQTMSITGALIVTTPQPVAIIDARKAIKMFKMKQINVPVIGLVENMSWCLIDDKKHYLFGRDGGKNLSQSEEISLLAELPLDQSIREAGDVGRPAALQETDLGNLFKKLALDVVDAINSRNQILPKTKKVEIKHNRGCN